MTALFLYTELMIRILLMLVTLMSFSVMAQERKLVPLEEYERVSEQKIIDLICMPTTVTLCANGCGTYSQEEIKRNRLKPTSNINLRVSETQVYDDTYYAMDRGDGKGFQQALFLNNIVGIREDGEEGTPFEGNYFLFTLNLLNSEYIYAVYNKDDDDKAELTQRYECELAKSLFD